MQETPPPPSFTNFILTSETGRYLYCSSLNFHQPNNKLAAKQQQQQQQQHSLERGYSGKVKEGGSPFSERRRRAFKKKDETEALSISVSSIEVNLDEENELSFSMGSLMVEEELYEPISLCVVSKFPLFDALQVGVAIPCVFVQR